AIDRSRIAQTISTGTDQPAVAFVPLGLAGYQPARMLDFNPAEAKNALAAAGYPDGKGFPKIQFLSTNTEENQQVFQLIQEMWKTNLGIDVELAALDFTTLDRNLRARNYNVSRAGWSGDYPDPNTFLNLWVSGGGNNDTGWSNKAYDDLIDQA